MKHFTILIYIAIFLTNNYTFSQNKKVLFEEFTNASCGPCAANNPLLKTYIDSKGDSIIAIKYHTEFPGFDPMHNLNPSQVFERRQGYYTDVNAVPWLKGDGDMFYDIWPFTIANFDAAFNARKVIVPKVILSVTDSRIPGDSVKSNINLNVVENLPPGNYKMRIMAVEKIVIYQTPPGNNGESVFEDVFRLGIPDMTGISIPLTTGNYQYTFKYKLNPEWNDTSIVTIAFIQNDESNKEVLNCASSDHITTGISHNTASDPDEFKLYQNFPNPFNPVTEIKFDIPEKSHVKMYLFNSLGKVVKLIVNQEFNAGNHKYILDGSELTSGVYFIKLISGNYIDSKKILLIK